MPAIRAGLLKQHKKEEVVVVKADPKAGPDGLVTVVPFTSSKPRKGVPCHEVSSFWGDIWVLVDKAYDVRAADLSNRWGLWDDIKSRQLSALKTAVAKVSQ